MTVKPQFPLKVFFHENGEEWVFENEEDAACNLEWFDSDDPEEHVSVTDSLGRPIRLKIQRLKVLTCEVLGSTSDRA